MPILVDIIALAFLAIRFKGLLVLASKIPNGNNRASLESGLLLAEFFLFQFFKGRQENLAYSTFHLTNFEFFLGVGAWTLRFRKRVGIAVGPAVGPVVGE